MKKLLIASNILLLGIILFQARSENGRNPDNHSVNRAVYAPAANPCRAGVCKDYTDIELPGLITGDLIKKMSIAYASDPGKAEINYNQPGAHGEDALSLCFDIEKIKNFIWHTENSVCRAGCDSSLKLGIRFYYIKYDTTGLSLRSPALKKWIVIGGNVNKHSLVMVPTYKRGTQWIDFDYQNVRSGCNFGNISSASHIFKATGLVTTASGSNHGGIGPPPKPGTYPTTHP